MSYHYENHDNIILDCTSVTSIGPLTTIIPESTTIPITLGSLTIDEQKICNSSVLITISGEIATPIQPLLPDTTLRVLKKCDGNTRQISPSFKPISGIIPIPATESFFYQICDSSGNEYCDCILYTVEFLPFAFNPPVTLSINNIFISARLLDN